MHNHTLSDWAVHLEHVMASSSMPYSSRVALAAKYLVVFQGPFPRTLILYDTVTYNLSGTLQVDNNRTST
jgi:hypothetical protein